MSRFRFDTFEHAETEPVFGWIEAKLISGSTAFRLDSEGHGAEMVLRVLGCALLAAMPRDGVAEAVTTLRDVLEFHTENVALSFPSTTVIREGKGTVVEKADRAPLLI